MVLKILCLRYQYSFGAILVVIAEEPLMLCTCIESCPKTTNAKLMTRFQCLWRNKESHMPRCNRYLCKGCSLSSEPRHSCLIRAVSLIERYKRPSYQGGSGMLQTSTQIPPDAELLNLYRNNKFMCLHGKCLRSGAQPGERHT
jgi:hypothetical protein